MGGIINPNIALGYKPPQFQITDPVQAIANVYSLKNLMTEGQYKGLQLQQLQQQIQEQQSLAKLFAAAYGGDNTQPAPIAGVPAAPLAPQQTSALPSVTPTAVAATPQPATVPPVSMSDLMNLPTVDRAAQMGALAGIPTLSQTPGGPLQPTPTPDALTNVFPPISPPAPAAGAVPAAPAAALPVVTPAAQPQFPTAAQILRVAPTTGMSVIKTMTDAQKDLLDLHIKQLDEDAKKKSDLAGLATGAVDNDSFAHNLLTAANKGYLPMDQARQYIQLGFDSPTVKTWLKSVQYQAITADKVAEMQLALARDAREAKLFDPQYAKSMADQREAEANAAAQSIGDVKDVKDLPMWLAQQGPTVAVRYGGLLGSGAPLEQIKQTIQMGAGGAQKVEEAKQQETAKYEAGLEPYIPMINRVLDGSIRLQDLSPAEQDKIKPELAKRGYGAPAAAPGAAAGGGFGKLISDAERERLGDYDRALTILDNTEQKRADNFNMMGPIKGQGSRNPFATNNRALSDYFVTQQQQLKKFITNGSLRGLTEETLNKVFPTITTDATEAKSQIQNLKDLILKEKSSYLRDLSDKVIPDALKPAPVAPPAQAAPKTETPAAQQPEAPIKQTWPKITLTSPAGSAAAAPATPPGKIKVHSPGPQGQDYWLDADKWPQYQKHGFTRAQ